MTAKSVAHQIIDALVARLAAIRQADGYQTDAGRCVKRARRRFTPDELPAIAVWRADETPDDNAQDKLNNRLTLAVEGHVLGDTDATGDELEYLLADLKQALFVTGGNGRALVSTARPRGLSNDIRPVGVLAGAREDGQASESVQLLVEIHFPELYGDPYEIL